MPGCKLKRRVVSRINERGGIGRVVLDRIVAGMSLAGVAKDLGCSRTLLSNLMNADPMLREALAHAKELAPTRRGYRGHPGSRKRVYPGIMTEPLRDDAQDWLARCGLTRPGDAKPSPESPEAVRLRRLHLEALKARPIRLHTEQPLQAESVSGL